MAQTKEFDGLIYRGTITDNIDSVLQTGIYRQSGNNSPYPMIKNGSIITVKRWDANTIYQEVDVLVGNENLPPVTIRRQKRSTGWGPWYQLSASGWTKYEP